MSAGSAAPHHNGARSDDGAGSTLAAPPVRDEVAPPVVDSNPPGALQDVPSPGTSQRAADTDRPWAHIVTPEATGWRQGAGTARLPAAERRRQLLDVAREVFADLGFHGASMNQVAEAAGVTKPVLYQHFGSKRALYRELVDDVSRSLEDAVVKATAEAVGPRHQVEAGLRAYFRFVNEHRAAFRLLFGSGTQRDAEFAKQVRRVEETLAEAVAALIDVEGLHPDHRRLLAHGIVGLSEGTCKHWVQGGYEPGADELAARVAELAWVGLRGLRPPGP